MDRELEERLFKLEIEINKIRERNKRVELDKAWETSVARKVTVAVLTYLTVVVIMMAFTVSDPWINAFIPTIGFLLSTSSLPLFKAMWTSRKNNSRRITV